MPIPVFGVILVPILIGIKIVIIFDIAKKPIKCYSFGYD
jgi:hypothetical protein